MQELRATGYDEETRPCLLGVVNFDQCLTSLALMLDTLIGIPFRMPDLLDDGPDEGEHALVVAFDDQAQRNDVELVVVEATEGYAYDFGESGEGFADTRMRRHSVDLPGACQPSSGWLESHGRDLRPGRGQRLRPTVA
jgi:hypothetical protein